MIGILNFGSAGNVASVANAFRRAGAQTKIVGRLGSARGMSGLVIPGVGSFSTVPRIAAALGGKNGLASLRVPVLCICLGMQALFSSSEEAACAKGLGIIPGKVLRIRGSVRLPQLGWNRVALSKRGAGDPLFAGIKEGDFFYFANSFAAFPASPDCVLGTTSYGQAFASAVRSGNFWGVQFHPEKSGKAGQKVIGNFVSICKASRTPAVPSIDILQGRAVRLRQGRQGTEEYFGNPILLAERYEKAGFPLLHVVDLDAAFGRKSQLPLLPKISAACPNMKIQWAGGMRSMRAARKAFLAGAYRVVFGTAVALSPSIVRRCAQEFGPERVWASLDFAGNPYRMRIRGWKEGAGFGLKQAIKLAESCGVGGIAVSSVDADGMGCGPGLSLLSSARRLTKLPVAIAGGIRSPRDAKAALAHGADFAIIGRAIYDRKIKTREWARLQALGRMAGMAQEDG